MVVALDVFDAEYAGQYPVEVGAYVGAKDGEPGARVGVPGAWVGVTGAIVEGNEVGAFELAE